MNWDSQFEAMMKGWIDSQRQVWNNYLSSIQGFNESEHKQMWESTLGVGEEMLRNIFKNQLQGLTAWVDGLAKAENAPAQIVESARQFQEMASRWNKLQAEMIQKWFHVLKKFAPSQPAADWAEIPENMFKTWQESTRGIMDVHSKQMHSWTEKRAKNENG